MPRVNERGTVGGSGAPWAISKISDMIWGVINVVVFYFRSLLDPFTGSIDSLRSGSSSSNGRGGPPRPPGRRNIRTIADALGGSDSIPPPPPGG